MNQRIADSWNETINSNRMCFILLEQCQIVILINQRPPPGLQLFLWIGSHRMNKPLKHPEDRN